MSLKNKIIAVDFDGTLCEFDFPNAGPPETKGFMLLQEYQQKGGRVILNTCRTDDHLDFAIEYCVENGLCPDSINAHFQDQIDAFAKGFPGYNPDCRKISADVYIDDKCVYFKKLGRIDWDMVREVIMEEENELYSSG